MSTTRKNARIAGSLYLLLALLAPLRLLYIPSTLIVRGDAATTARNIASHETLFRLGIFSELLCGVVLVFLVLALYRLFETVDRGLAALVVILGGVIPAAIDFVIVITDAAALILVRGADYLSVFAPPERHALALLFLDLHRQEILAAEILWGLWLFPLGILALRSGFVPRLLGGWLIVNGFAYLAISFTGLLAPGQAAWVDSVTFPALLGEIAFVLYLLIRGTRPGSAPEAVP